MRKCIDVDDVRREQDKEREIYILRNTQEENNFPSDSFQEINRLLSKIQFLSCNREISIADHQHYASMTSFHPELQVPGRSTPVGSWNQPLGSHAVDLITAFRR